jgi:hypothetical protein
VVEQEDLGLSSYQMKMMQKMLWTQRLDIDILFYHCLLKLVSSDNGDVFFAGIVR